MPVTDLGAVSVPPAAAAWIDRLLLVCLGLFAAWLVLKIAGYMMRRAYNLTPVATAGAKGVTPDFLRIDAAAQAQTIARGRAFDRGDLEGFGRAAHLTRMGMVASGFLSFAVAAFLAFGRVEEFDRTWRNLSGRDRFLAIVETHPVGFAIALTLIVAAMAKLLISFRTAR